MKSDAEMNEDLIDKMVGGDPVQMFIDDGQRMLLHKLDQLDELIIAIKELTEQLKKVNEK